MRGIKAGLATVACAGLLAGATVGVAAAQESETSRDVAEPVPFTARFIPSSSVRTGTIEDVDGIVQQRGNAWTPVMAGVTDPRMDGTLTYSEDYDVYPGGHHFATVTYRIVNDGGAWNGSGRLVRGFSVSMGDQLFDDETVLLIALIHISEHTRPSPR